MELPRKRSESLLRLLLAGSLVLPLLMFSAASWISYTQYFRDARDRLDRTLDVVHEHAAKVLETQGLIVSQVNQLLEGLSDEEILVREEAVQARLTRVSNSLPQINSVWVYSREGRPLLATNLYPAPHTLNLSDRMYFKFHQDAAPGLGSIYVSEKLEGRAVPGNYFLAVTSRRPSVDGNFNGVVNVSLDVKYFESFYEKVSTGGFQSVTLTRSDGTLLARYPRPTSNVTRLPPGGAFHEALRVSSERGIYETVSLFDNTARIIAYRKLPDVPIYVTTAIDRAYVTGQWLKGMARHLLFGIPATLALFALSWVALRRSRREAGIVEALASESRRREQTEEQLRQAQKMDAIGRLTGGIAHDFNNLLTIVIGSLDLLGRRLGEGDARAAKLAEAAMDGAKRAASLTARLLAFSRQQPLEPKPTDINALVAGMSELLRRSIGEQISVETVLAGGLWRTMVDRNQLENALLNLAVNARDAMNGDGKLTIETANTYLDEVYAEQTADVTAGQYVMISMTDTGGGMSPDVVRQAFEPFFSTKGPGGTGLGLSQVYGFVKQSGGHAKIYSELGHGTTVKIYLRRFAATGAELPEATVSVPLSDITANGETILVLEDDPGVLSFTAQSLRQLGYEVVECGKPSLALAMLAANPDVTLLLTDVVMPGMTGRQVAEQALQFKPALKVVYMTGYTRNAIVHNGILDPGTELVAKPFTIQQLGSKLRSVLNAR